MTLYDIFSKLCQILCALHIVISPQDAVFISTRLPKSLVFHSISEFPITCSGKRNIRALEEIDCQRTALKNQSDTPAIWLIRRGVICILPSCFEQSCDQTGKPVFREHGFICWITQFAVFEIIGHQFIGHHLSGVTPGHHRFFLLCRFVFAVWPLIRQPFSRVSKGFGSAAPGGFRSCASDNGQHAFSAQRLSVRDASQVWYRAYRFVSWRSSPFARKLNWFPSFYTHFHVRWQQSRRRIS